MRSGDALVNAGHQAVAFIEDRRADAALNLNLDVLLLRVGFQFALLYVHIVDKPSHHVAEHGVRISKALRIQKTHVVFRSEVILVCTLKTAFAQQRIQRQDSIVEAPLSLVQARGQSLTHLLFGSLKDYRLVVLGAPTLIDLQAASYAIVLRKVRAIHRVVDQ